MPRGVELEQIGAAFTHLAGALEERPFFHAQRWGRQIGVDPGPGQQLDTARSPDAALERPVDRDALDLDVRGDLGAVSHDQLAARADAALEMAVDPEGFLEGQISLKMAALVYEPVQGCPVGFDSHLPLSLSNSPMSSSSDPKLISILPPRR